MNNDSQYATFLKKLAKGSQIVVRNVVTGELMFHLNGKTHCLGCNQTLNLSALATLRELKLATSVHNLIASGQLRLES